MNTHDDISSVIRKALETFVAGTEENGIMDAEVASIETSPELLRHVACDLAETGRSTITIEAQVDVYLRLSNDDLLQWPDVDRYELQLQYVAAGQLEAIVSSVKDWSKSWETGMAPLKQPTMAGIRETVYKLDPLLSSDDPTFMTAVVLLASEIVGPYVELLANFTGYKQAFIKPMAERLYAAGLWKPGFVHALWLDPSSGTSGLALAILVAQGDLEARWSHELSTFQFRGTSECLHKVSNGSR